MSELTDETKMKLSDWLDEFIRDDKTKTYYQAALRCWIKSVYGPNSVDDYTKTFTFSGGEESTAKMMGEVTRRTREIDTWTMKYLDDDRDLPGDMREFVRWAEKDEYAPSTIHNFCGMVKTYFDDVGGKYEISERDWRRVKVLMRPNKPVTQDDAPTKEQLKMILSHASVHGRAWILFLESSGARQGEVIQLKMIDINMDADPPYANIRAEYTKKKISGRRVWYNYETRDALREWFKVKDTRRKKIPGGELFPKDMVWGFGIGAAQYLWRSALEKAGLNKRDTNTKKRIHIYHMHTLRKFFRSAMGEAGVPDVIVHAWMGHSAYLSEAYDRIGNPFLSKMYKEKMDVVTIYEQELSQQLKDKYEAKRLEAEENARRANEVTFFIDSLGRTFDVDDRMTIQEKMDEIMTKAALVKYDREELDDRYRLDVEKLMKRDKLLDGYRSDMEKLKEQVAMLL